MSDAPRLRTLSGIIYEQTEVQWAVDNRIFGSNVQLVPIDGADQGKHKLGNGINTYAELGFVEDGGGGGTVMSVDGTKYDELITLFGTVDAQADLTIDFTALVDYPNIAFASYVSSAQTETDAIVGIPYAFELNNFKISFVDVSDGSPAQEGVAVQATFMIKHA
jgi:hypothetical protein